VVKLFGFTSIHLTEPLMGSLESCVEKAVIVTVISLVDKMALIFVY
jgi:hypothetical protein